MNCTLMKAKLLQPIVLAVLWLCTVTASAQGSYGRVSDEAELFDLSQELDLSGQFTALEAMHKTEVFVVTLKSVPANGLDQHATNLTKAWEIKPENNGNGVLIVVAVEGPSAELVVKGATANEKLDARAVQIIEENLLFELQKGDWHAALKGTGHQLFDALQGWAPLKNKAIGKQKPAAQNPVDEVVDEPEEAAAAPSAAPNSPATLRTNAAGIPVLLDRVSDYANILPADSAASLINRLAAIEKATSAQVAILTLESLGSHELEPYTNQIFNSWGLGQADKNNGVLLLVAKSDRKVRIEVGYGLESHLPDMMAGRIIRNIIAPKFKQERYASGLSEAVTAIELALLNNATADPRLQPQQAGSGLIIGGALIFMLLSFLGIMALVVGFVIVWIKLVRASLPKRSKSGQYMTLLSEEKEDAHLSEQQQFQKEIGSVDYDVWQAPDKSEIAIEVFAGKQRYYVCSKCNYEAGKPLRYIKRRAKNGEGTMRIVVYKCLHCKHQGEQPQTGINKMKQRTNRPVRPQHSFIKRMARRGRMSSGSSSGFSSGSSFSGGGGSSGGGGASGSW